MSSVRSAISTTARQNPGSGWLIGLEWNRCLLTGRFVPFFYGAGNNTTNTYVLCYLTSGGDPGQWVLDILQGTWPVRLTWTLKLLSLITSHLITPSSGAIFSGWNKHDNPISRASVGFRLHLGFQVLFLYYNQSFHSKCNHPNIGHRLWYNYLCLDLISGGFESLNVQVCT